MTVQNEPSAKTHGVILTERPPPRRSRCWTRRTDDLALRIAVQPGCAGRYNLSSTTGR